MYSAGRRACALCLSQRESFRTLARPSSFLAEVHSSSLRRNLSTRWSSPSSSVWPIRKRSLLEIRRGPFQEQRRSYSGGAQSPIIPAASVYQQDAAVAAAADSWLPFLPSLSTALQALPEALHITGPYATSITILLVTVALRSTITLPITIWQKRSLNRMADKVIPEWKEAQKRLPAEVGRKMARKRASMAKYKLELNKEARSVLKGISKKYNYHPTLTLLLPIIVNIPLFLLLSAVIRHGCVPPTPWAGELAPFPWAAPSADLQAKFAASAKLLADRGLDAQQVAMMAPKAGPSLIEKDPTGFGGVLFGMVTLLSVELGNWRRTRMQAGATELAQEQPQPRPQSRPLQPGKAPQSKAADPVKEEKVSVNSLRQMILSNSMRGLGIILIPVAMHAPSALLVYWLSTMSYTLAQNIILAILDRRKAPAAADRK